MRIDDENEVVWCSDINDLAFIGNKITLVLVDQLIKFDGSYSLCELQDNYYESCNDKKIDLLYAILNGYSFKLEQPQKYYWRKKKEYQTKYEQEHSYGYLVKGISVPYIISGYGSTFTYTEQEARDLLKDDFNKFEKVECE